MVVVVVVVLAGVYQSSSSETGASFVVVVAGDGADADKTVQLASVSVALAGRSLVSSGAQLQVGGFGDVEPVKAAELEQAGVRRGIVLILSAFRRPVAPLSCLVATGTVMTVAAVISWQIYAPAKISPVIYNV